jgi:hypothetical protein
MKIECILRRDPPTVVVLGNMSGPVQYKFLPDEQGRHVCEVEDNAHIARLLSISEAYRLPGDAPIPQDLIPAIVEQTLPTAAAVLAPVDEYAIRGSEVHPRTFDLGGDEPTHIDDVVAHALDLSGLPTSEWNSLPDEDRHNFIDLALDDLDTREPADVTEEPVRAPVVEVAKLITETAPVSVAGNSNGAASKESPVATDADKAQYEAEREAAAVAYKAKFGARPHYKWSIEKINEELAKPVEPAKEEGAE